jgi:hypothetical protein
MTEAEWFAEFERLGEAEVERSYEEHDFKDDDYEDAMEAAATWLRRRRQDAPRRIEALQAEQAEAASRAADAAERAAASAEQSAIEARRANTIARTANGIAQAAAAIAAIAIILSIVSLALGHR